MGYPFENTNTKMSATIKSENTPDYLLIESAGILTSKKHLFKYIQMVTDEIFKN